MAKNDYKIDPKEQDILDSFNRGEWVSKGENLDKYKLAAKQTFAKTHRINFRVSERDFRGSQVKAREEGIPYQTLISSILHKYVNGGVPPEMKRSMEPPTEQLGSVSVRIIDICEGSASTANPTTSHPMVSVTVTLYVPALSPDKSSVVYVVSPSSQRNE